MQYVCLYIPSVRIYQWSQSVLGPPCNCSCFILVAHVIAGFCSLSPERRLEATRLAMQMPSAVQDRVEPHLSTNLPRVDSALNDCADATIEVRRSWRPPPPSDPNPNDTVSAPRADRAALAENIALVLEAAHIHDMPLDEYDFMMQGAMKEAGEHVD
jgi:hypothetical protein